jgi:hypothetical protein
MKNVALSSCVCFLSIVLMSLIGGCKSDDSGPTGPAIPDYPYLTQTWKGTATYGTTTTYLLTASILASQDTCWGNWSWTTSGTNFVKEYFAGKITRDRDISWTATSFEPSSAIWYLTATFTGKVSVHNDTISGRAVDTHNNVGTIVLAKQ